jgi:hypothetical protein
MLPLLLAVCADWPTCTAVKGIYLSKDIIQLILEDHNRGREMYRQYMAPSTNAKQKQLLAWHMIRESSVHSYKEEEVGTGVFPVSWQQGRGSTALAAAAAATGHVHSHNCKPCMTLHGSQY